MFLLCYQYFVCYKEKFATEKYSRYLQFSDQSYEGVV